MTGLPVSAAAPPVLPAFSPNWPYLPAVDHIRVFAALLVVVYHSLLSFGLRQGGGTGDLFSNWPHTDNPLLAMLIEGHTGVGGFMVLSGFIFMQGTIGRDLNAGAFLRNRVLRIYPLYLTLLVFGACVHRADFALLPFLQSVLPLANFAGAADYGAFTPLSWAVAVEFQFYLLFPLLLRLLQTHGAGLFLRLILFLILLRAAAVLPGSNVVDLTYATIAGRLDEFLIGMLAGAWFARRAAGGAAAGPWLIAALPLFVGVIFLFHRAGGWPAHGLWKIVWPDIEGLAWAGFILTWLGAARWLPGLLSRALAAVGRTSYSIYLMHIMVVGMLRNYLPQLASSSTRTTLLVIGLVVIPLVLAVAAFVYVTIEKPFMSLRKRYTGAPIPA